MKKILVVMIAVILGCGGFLFYDWYTKTQMRAAEPSILQYSWTDAKGIRHFTDSPPPKGATNIEETKGYKYIEPPLVMTIKNKAIDYYQHIKETLFKSKKKKKKKIKGS